METGSRRDIVRSDGLRWTSFFLRAPDQSTYSVESALAQNRLSASSFLNSGIFFFAFRIDFGFISVHIADRDDPNEPPPHRKGHKQPAAQRGLSQPVVPFLALRQGNSRPASIRRWL
jgi:hypothetical protein